MKLIWRTETTRDIPTLCHCPQSHSSKEFSRWPVFLQCNYIEKSLQLLFFFVEAMTFLAYGTSLHPKLLESGGVYSGGNKYGTRVHVRVFGRWLVGISNYELTRHVHARKARYVVICE